MRIVEGIVAAVLGGYRSETIVMKPYDSMEDDCDHSSKYLVFIVCQHVKGFFTHFDDPVDYIRKLKNHLRVGSVIAVIEPYLEIDSIGRKVIQASKAQVIRMKRDGWVLMQYHQHPNYRKEHSSEGQRLEKALGTAYKTFDDMCHRDNRLQISLLLASIQLKNMGFGHVSTALALSMVGTPFQVSKLNTKPYPQQYKQFRMAAMCTDKLLESLLGDERLLDLVELDLQIEIKEVRAIDNTDGNTNDKYTFLSAQLDRPSGYIPGFYTMRYLSNVDPVNINTWLEPTAPDFTPVQGDMSELETLRLLGISDGFQKGMEYGQNNERMKAIFCYAAVLVQFKYAAKIFYTMAMMLFTHIRDDPYHEHTQSYVNIFHYLRTTLFWEPGLACEV
ncbi:hypothetical protein HDU76_009555, partial [Blyttiomyces sp. JEL0837]